MSDKFTSGPWECDDTHVRTSINSGRKHIAMVNLANNRDYEISLEEHIANAKLIAAAPELLTALEKTCKNAIDLGYCIESDCVDCENMKARKKARGE